MYTGIHHIISSSRYCKTDASILDSKILTAKERRGEDTIISSNIIYSLNEHLTVKNDNVFSERHLNIHTETTTVLLTLAYSSCVTSFSGDSVKILMQHKWSISSEGLWGDKLNDADMHPLYVSLPSLQSFIKFAVLQV